MRTLLLLTLSILALQAAEPYFSEYVEGSSNNKAIEIANPGSEPLDLGGYRLEVYFNGGTTASINHVPSVVLAPGAVYVFAHGASHAAILAVAGATTSSGLWNGDDALVLRRIAGGAVVDSLGQVGSDPGTAWSGGGLSTLDRTLRRTQVDHDSDPSDAFDPSATWTGFAVDTFDDLGVATGGGGLPTLGLTGPTAVEESAGLLHLGVTRSSAAVSFCRSRSTSSRSRSLVVRWPIVKATMKNMPNMIVS